MRNARADEGRGDDGEVPDGSHPVAGTAPSGPVCELCGGPLLDRHCKLLCLNCGYQRDCSDP